MIEIITLLLRVAGAGLIFLALLHIPIGRRLGWRDDIPKLTPVNASIFRVHTFFICLVLILMGLPCLIEPRVFIDPTPAGKWLSWSIASFWTIRLYCQFFVYRADLWRGKRMETVMHVWFSIVWTFLATLFAVCGLRQSGWITG